MKDTFRTLGRWLILLCAVPYSVVAGAAQEPEKGPGLLDQARGVLTVAPVIEVASPAVVNVAVRTRVPEVSNPLLNDPFFRRFFGGPDRIPSRRVLSAGSGVIVDAENGYVLTNHHVIDRAEQISIKLKDGRRLKAKIVGSDAATDIGLVQIEAKRLTALSFGDSKKLKVGDFVVAIGNPFGLGQTVTSGIVSALGRSGIRRDKFEDFIQTDAAINPGNSGGALIDTRGKLVGINTSIVARGGGNVGIGFAVPANMARSVMEQLIRHGEVRRGRIGVFIQSVTPEIAQALDLPAPRGALVSQVEKGSPAEIAGLQPGDAIIEVDGQPIEDSNQLRNAVGLRERGSTLELSIIRKGVRKSIKVRIGAKSTPRPTNAYEIEQLRGAKISEIPSNHPDREDIDGVYVTAVVAGSPAWQVGLRTSDIILAVDREPVGSLQEFKRVAKTVDEVFALNLLRGNTEIFIVVQ